MKQLFTTIAIMGLAILLGSCGGNNSEKTTEDSVYAKPVSETGINSMTEYNLNGKLEVDGAKYYYEFFFNNDKTLPIVNTEEGLKYYDNNVKLKIKKGDETTFEHTFTKESFKNLVPEEFYKKALLVGFNYNYMQQEKHDKFYFIAVVGNPDEASDIEYSIGIAIDKNGNISTSIVNNVDVEPMHDDLNQDPAEDAA